MGQRYIRFGLAFAHCIPDRVSIKWTLGIIIGVLLSYPVVAASVYKYQDAKGRWRFSDRPPSDKQIPTETLIFEATPENPFELKFEFTREGEQHLIRALNPFHIPIEIKIQFGSGAEQELTAVIPSKDKSIIYSGSSPASPFRYSYVWGMPGPEVDQSPYRIPIKSPSKHLISQSFYGTYSHQRQPNLHAVDIATPIGTDIVAARSGTVFVVQDNFALGGVQEYFIDKANTVVIAHDDGTYATYAHLLLGSAAVALGQRVQAGDLLGQSGTSGFSSGPHLHFVVRQNAGFSTESLAFTFEHAEGVFAPKENQEICPCP